LISAKLTAQIFRVVAIAEAVTWLALLIAMFFKWVLGHEEAIAIPGMTHGIVFMVYVVVALFTAWRLKWNLFTTGLALLASIPPFGTVVFEVWAKRKGLLDGTETPSKVATA
jgi:integral membrane protein